MVFERINARVCKVLTALLLEEAGETGSYNGSTLVCSFVPAPLPVNAVCTLYGSIVMEI